MSKSPEPSYRTEYVTTGKHIDPETGTDLTEWSADSVRAFAENLFPDHASDNFSDEAKERKAILLKIAKAKDN